MSQNYGTKRIVTGAHYGLRDWMAQRVTAVLMALFTIVLLAQVICFTPLAFLLISGAVPGNTGSIVIVRPSKKKTSAK